MEQNLHVDKYDSNFIESKIHYIRHLQVIIDKDLAELYDVSTKALNQAVKRNIERFPSEFMFQLNSYEFDSLRSQIVTSNQKGGRRYLPYAFTEQGVAMLSAVLRSDRAVRISIQIINAFIQMRRFLSGRSNIYNKINLIESDLKSYQQETDFKLNQIFDIINQNKLIPNYGIFYEGQIFDAYKFVVDIIKSAKKSITLIDNYVDETILYLFAKNADLDRIRIFTKILKKDLKKDIEKYNSQYQNLEIYEFELSHDRFLIIDEQYIYHIGASIKDLGKRWFAFSKMDNKVINIVEKIDNYLKNINQGEI